MPDVVRAPTDEEHMHKCTAEEAIKEILEGRMIILVDDLPVFP